MNNLDKAGKVGHSGKTETPNSLVVPYLSCPGQIHRWGGHGHKNRDIPKTHIKSTPEKNRQPIKGNPIPPSTDFIFF